MMTFTFWKYPGAQYFCVWWVVPCTGWTNGLWCGGPWLMPGPSPSPHWGLWPPHRRRPSTVAVNRHHTVHSKVPEAGDLSLWSPCRGRPGVWRVNVSRLCLLSCLSLYTECPYNHTLVIGPTKMPVVMHTVWPWYAIEWPWQSPIQCLALRLNYVFTNKNELNVFSFILGIQCPFLESNVGEYIIQFSDSFFFQCPMKKTRWHWVFLDLSMSDFKLNVLLVQTECRNVLKMSLRESLKKWFENGLIRTHFQMTIKD